MINPSLDPWVWLTASLFMALMGARAWVVETGSTRPGGKAPASRLLHGAVGVTLAVLVGLLTIQGGALLVTSIINGTEPNAAAVAPEGPPAAAPAG